MFLKKLELQGFKSFPEKIKLDFEKGITAVVGPNGSGKSNISDAIRWVIGEQNVRNLRGDKMEDVIFIGTKNRKKLSFAEVSITIDNIDQKLNIAFNEVTITRRVYRSGESNYYINGSACRLKDIHELFMDTGVGKEGYSIIGQGKIDAILNHKSDERRTIFEEAVGIVKFKNRKLQAEQKLNDVKQNLIRTTDIIKEIETQLEPIQIQAEKTKTYLELSKKLKDTRLVIFAHEYSNHEQKIEKLKNDILAVSNNIKKHQDEKDDFEKKSQNFKNDLLKYENKVEQFNKTSFESLKQIEQTENDIKLKTQTINFLNQDINRLINEEKNYNDAISQKKSQIKLIETTLQAKTLEKSLKTKNLEQLEANFKKMNIEINQNKDIIDNFNNQIVEKLKNITEIDIELNNFNNLYNQNTQKEIQINNEISFLKSKINEKTIKNQVLEQNLNNLKNTEDKFSLNLNKNNLKAVSLNKEIDLLKIENESTKKTLIELTNKHKILKELEKDYDGYYNSVKTILKEKQTNKSFNGICGAVAELIKVDEKFETAIEVALGSSLQHIVTKTENDAKIAIDFLKNNKKGRATFLPISSIKAKNIEGLKNEILKQTGVLGIANEVVSFNDEYSLIMLNLLGRVIIVDNIENALNFCKKYKYAYKTVTLDGDVLSNSGALTGGSVLKKINSIFSRTREITKTKEMLQKHLSLSENINKNFELKINELNKLNNYIEETKENIQKIYIEKSQILNEINQNKEYLNDMTKNINNFEIQIKDLFKFQENNKSSLEYYKNLKNKLNTEINELKLKLENFKIKIENNQINKEDNFNEINNLKILINSINHEIFNNNLQIENLENQIKESILKQNNIKQEISNKNEQKQVINNQIEQFNNKIITLKNNYNVLLNDFNTIQKQKDDTKKIINELTEKIINHTKKIGQINNEKVKLELKKEALLNYIQQLSNNMWEDYEITYAMVCNKIEKADIDISSLQKKEKDIKIQINLMGTINPNAIDDFKVLKQRYELNISQKKDILASEENLRNIIIKLEKEMEEQFKEQFKIINKNFNEVFSQMFGGGNAQIILADKENILTSGVEIVASPPGKTLQNLNLLSGGERTLTAMALLFAILRMKPSPFCILDETEAALDDANVNRYANFLKNFSKNNQFIVITHKTGTMEISDVLYGVTMQEQGVSKLISVKLNDAKEYTH